MNKMTPKEKAFELVTKYSRILPMNQTTLLDRKNCALVAVDEILEIVPKNNGWQTSLEYWIKVKQELEKL